MSAAIATYDAVATAARELRKLGLPATADNVIKHLGGGAKVTVLTHLRKLRAEDAPSEPALPHTVLELVRPVIAQVYAAGSAAQIEEGRAREERQHRMMDELDIQIEELSTENTRLNEEIERLTQEVLGLRSEHSSSEERLAKSNRELQRLRSQLAASKAGDEIKQTLARLTASVEALNSNATPMTPSSLETSATAGATTRREP